MSSGFTHASAWAKAATVAERAAAQSLGPDFDWLDELTEFGNALKSAGETPENGSAAEPCEAEELAVRELGLLQLFAIPIRQARRRLTADLGALREQHVELSATILSDPAAIEILLFRQLLPSLLLKSCRTLTLELNVARLQEELVGETPAERYQSFLKRLGQPDVALAILTEYPVLARQALLMIDQWRRFSLEFVRNLCADWSRLCETFALTPEDASVVELKGDAGDRHCDGRTVQLLVLRSGRRLVYKPRSLAADQRFQELLAWCNDQDAQPQFRTLTILDAGDHGWVEFVEHSDCQTADQIERFYRRQGAYLALLHAVGANDIHFENLIAAGEHPVLVDLETLFHQRLPGLSQDPAGQGMSHSVISVRLLPRVSYVEGVENAIDFSALGAKAGQEIPYPERRFESDGTDEMHVRQGHAVVPKGTHRPTLLSAEISLESHGQDLMRGYLDMYDVLLRNRHALLAADGPLAAFADVETRFIARVSQIYFIFLDHSFHPDHLRDGLDRDRWFDGLWKQVEPFPGLTRLIHAEREALYRNDIPLFHACPSSRDLVGSTGERIENFFERTALEIAHDRIRGMGPDDLARQTWMIRSSLAMLPEVFSEENPDADRFDADANPDECLAAACRVGDQLAALAYQTDTEAGWLGFQPRQRGWSISALELDAEDGLPGVALFLLELGLATGERRYTDLARKTMVGVTRRLAAAERGAISTDLRFTLMELAELGSCVDDARLREELGYAVRLAEEAGSPVAAHAEEPAARRWRPLPRRFEAPGLRGGLAGRGHDLLRRANAASLRPACTAAETWI